MFSCSRRKTAQLSSTLAPRRQLQVEFGICRLPSAPSGTTVAAASAGLKTRPLLLLRSQQESYLLGETAHRDWGDLFQNLQYIICLFIYSVLFCCKGFSLTFSDFLLQVEPSAAHQLQSVEGQNDLKVWLGDEMHHTTGHLLANSFRLLCCQNFWNYRTQKSKEVRQKCSTFLRPVVCEKLTKSWGIHRNRHEAIIRRDLI